MRPQPRDLCLAASLVFGACTPLARGLPDADASPDTRPDAPSRDAAPDVPDAVAFEAGADASDAPIDQPPRLDAPDASDAALDALDATLDATLDAARDAVLDVAPDAPEVTDAPRDTLDAARDAPDAPDDVAPDASAPPDAAPDVRDVPDVSDAPSCVPSERARPLMPPTGSRVTTRRPMLRWALPAGADGATVELCSDRACTAPLLGSFSASGTSARVGAVAALARAVVWWRVRPSRGGSPCGAASVAWSLWPARRDTGDGRAWRPVADFNGDGRADAAIGAHRAVGGGRVDVHLGQADGLPAASHQAIAAPLGVTDFGNVATGDFNGDGLTDLAASTLVTSGGRVWTLLSDGSRLQDITPVAQPADSGALFGLSLHTGDVDGDGYTDLIVPTGHQATDARGGRLHVYRGGPRGVEAMPSTTLTGMSASGTMLASNAAVFDLDDDGDDDVVASLNEDARRAFRVLRGSPAGLQVSTTLVATVAGRSIPGGVPVALGDVSGDGQVDVGFFDRGVTPQRLYVLTRIVADQTDAEGFFTTLTDAPTGLRALVGMDWTADGLGDVVISQDVSPAARIYLYPSTGSSLGAPVVLAPASGEPGFGSGLSVTFGDYNGDGFEDLLWALSSFSGGNGAWALWPGAAGGPSMGARRVIVGMEAAAGLGVRVAWRRSARGWRCL